MICRGYSRCLERAITDLGADCPFGAIPGKMKEHYGVTVPCSSARLIVEKHAYKIRKFQGSQKKHSEEKEIISETDGCMVPIVEMPQETRGVDLRKHKTLVWKEAKLSFARGKNKVDRIYGGLIGTPQEMGKEMKACVEQVGLGEKSKIHAIGDGAPWILEQINEQFGTKADYCIDFFHLCEYLYKAAPWMGALDPNGWVKKTKKRMKQGAEKEVLQELKQEAEKLEESEESNGLLKCYHYMKKRIQYMNYKSVLERKLPIGSGEIESSHRYIIQRRLKLAGAWWKEENANAMLGLRIKRYNGLWEEYWESESVRAA